MSSGLGGWLYSPSVTDCSEICSPHSSHTFARASRSSTFHVVGTASGLALTQPGQRSMARQDLSPGRSSSTACTLAFRCINERHTLCRLAFSPMHSMSISYCLPPSPSGAADGGPALKLPAALTMIAGPITSLTSMRTSVTQGSISAFRCPPVLQKELKPPRPADLAIAKSMSDGG